MTPVSSWLTRPTPQNSKGNIGSGAPNERGVGKICNFQSISRHISETVHWVQGRTSDSKRRPYFHRSVIIVVMVNITDR